MEEKLEIIRNELEKLRMNPFAATSASKLYTPGFLMFKKGKPTLLEQADLDSKRKEALALKHKDILLVQKDATHCSGSEVNKNGLFVARDEF